MADDALALQDAGCFAIVFEAVPAAVTEMIMERMRIPVIGIGAGAATDGQVLVFHDLLGIYEGHAPRFAKRFAELKRAMVEGVRAYADEVRERSFPAAEHSYASTRPSWSASARCRAGQALGRRRLHELSPRDEEALGQEERGVGSACVRPEVEDAHRLAHPPDPALTFTDHARDERVGARRDGARAPHIRDRPSRYTAPPCRARHRRATSPETRNSRCPCR